MERYLKQNTEIAQRKKSRLKNIFKILLLILAVCPTANAVAQTDSLAHPITIKGMVRDEFGQPISNVIIINKRTRSGVFGKADGSFSLQCDRPDTVVITSLGFHPRSLCFVDSLGKTVFNAEIYLDTRTYRLASVEVFAQRDLEKIQEDIEKLGYDEDDYMLSGINAVRSPITFLYQQFSRKERSKRLVAEMENEDRKRELLKELFQHYVDYDIINLNNDQFDEFITYLNVSDEFLLTSTQYDFLIYVKDRFKDYKVYQRQQKTLKETDFDYDKD
jgi:hypothetical protein